jgi:hypothetical protein
VFPPVRENREKEYGQTKVRELFFFKMTQIDTFSYKNNADMKENNCTLSMHVINISHLLTPFIYICWPFM